MRSLGGMARMLLVLTAVSESAGAQECRQVAKLTASDGATGDMFGWSVAISGTTAIVGASRDDDRGKYSGSAYVFEKSGNMWSQVAKLTASDGAAEDWFGWSVAISGTTAIVGAYGDDDRGENSGSAYVFDVSGSADKETKFAAGGNDHPVPGAIGPSGCDLSARKPAKETSLAVLDFYVGENIPRDASWVLADATRQAVQVSHAFTLITREDMKELLEEEDLTATLRCDEKECLVDYGKKLKAQFLLHGKVAQIEGAWRLTLRVLNVSSGREEAIQRTRGATLDELEAQIDSEIACKLLTETLAKINPDKK